MGQRLVTENDYRYYVMNICNANDIVDCRVQNNWTYMTTFYKWLYNLGLNGYFTKQHGGTAAKRSPAGLYYINESRLVKSDYQYSDAADSNNVYIWTKMEYGKVKHLADLYSDNIQRLKSATAEVVFLEPVTVNFAITAAPEEEIQKYIKQNVFDELNESYIELTLDSDILYTSAAVKNEIENVIIDFFRPINNKLGQQIKYSDLLEKIYAVTGIQRVRTVYRPLKTVFDENGNPSVVNDDSRNVVIKDGLNFATWSADYVDVGDDLDASNIMKTLEPFQFPYLISESLTRKIKIIKKSISNTDQISN